MSVVITNPKVTRKDIYEKLLSVKFVTEKNEDGTYTAKVDKQDVSAVGDTEREAMIAVQKALKAKIVDEGTKAIKRTDLTQGQ